METTTAFVLNDAIVSWRDGLSRSPHVREEDLAELEAHLRDSVAALQSRGLTDEESFLLAARRLGNPSGLEPEFAKVNRREVWLNRLLWMLVGIQAWGLVCGLSHAVGDAAVLGSLAGLGYNYQPSFRGTFPWADQSLLPAALLLLAHLLALAGGVGVCWWLALRKEHTVRERIAKALRRPVLAGLCLVVLSMLFASVSIFEVQLFQRFYSQTQFGTIITSKTLAAVIFSPLQVIGMVAFTVLLLRRRFRLSNAS